MPEEKEINENFDWDGNSDSISFFGEDTIVKAPEAKDVITDLEKDDITDEDKTDPKAKEEKEEKDLKDSLFSAFDVEEEEVDPSKGDGEEEEEEGEPAAKVSEHATHLEYLKSKGIVDYELEEGTELTPELADEILEDAIEEKVEGRVEELFKDLPDIVKQINKFALAKGDLTEFFRTLTKSNSASSGFDTSSDISDVKVQESVIRHNLKTEGFDDEHIDSQIEFYKDSNKMESVSKKYFDKFVESDKQSKEALVKSASDRKAAEKEKERQYKAGLISTLKSIEDVNGMKFNEAEKNELPSYMSDRNIKMKSGASVTSMQKDLYEALQDPNKSLVIAKLLKNNFDFKEFSKEAKASVASDVRQNLQNNNNTPKKSTGGGAKTKKPLSSFF